MSENSISIVPKKSHYPDPQQKALEILDWLVSADIVKGELSDCTLSTGGGFAVSEGATKVTLTPQYLPFTLWTCGLEIVTQRQLFHTFGNGIEQCICPNCTGNIANEEDWGFLFEWLESETDEIACPLCGIASDVHSYKFEPEWGFSDLGFTFWNWPELTPEFIEEFRNRLGCDVSVVYQHI